MAGSINKVILIGNVGKEPEVKSTQGGQKTVSFSLATSEAWNDKYSGERQERTEWHRIVVFNEHIADLVDKYCRKGTKVYLEGTLQTRKWTDQGGKDRYTTEVVVPRFRGELILLSSRRDGDSYERPAAPRREPAGAGADNGRTPGGGDLDDEVPFGPCWQ